MFDFPASPTTGTVSNGYVYDGIGWAGGPGVSGPVTEQYFVVAGGGSYDIAVPTWAKACRIDGFTYVTTSAYIGLRVSADGTTFPAGASDYQFGGPTHQSGSAAYTSQPPMAFHNIPLTQTGDNPSIVHSFTTEMDVVRPATSNVFSCRSYAKSLDSGGTTGWRTYHGFGYVVGTTLGSALALKSIRIFPSAGLFGPGSFIRVKWIGDSAAIPQSNAIADAPNDGAWYLRQSGAWTKTSAMPRLSANKGAGNRVLAVGKHGIYESASGFATNVGGWTVGAATGLTGYDIIVPRTGLYHIVNRSYNQSMIASARLDVSVNGGAIGCFIQGTGSLDGIMEASIIYPLTAGDRLAYEVMLASFGGYHGVNHTEVKAVMIGSQ